MSASMFYPSDADSDEDSHTTHSTQSSKTRKKRKANIVSDRNNKSHTSFFFHIDKNDSDLVYCKICEYDLSGSYRKPYAYTRKGGNTSSMIAHLRDKHGITKDNFTNYLDEYREPKWDQSHQTQVTDYYSSSKPCPAKRQELLARKLIQFIIHFVLPLYILQNRFFREFIYACEPGFRIPCDKTAKGLIHEAYEWSYNQLSALLRSSVTNIHLTTDLWTAKSRYGYLGVTATWLTSDFDSVERQPCAAHTLQLSVQEGLKQCKAIHRHVKSLQAFFRLSKQAQRLHKAQKAQNESNQAEGDVQSPLDLLTDVKTRWNSTYLAWKRLLELHNSIRFVSTSLLSKSDRASQKDGEKLERLCLLVGEKEFLQEVVKLLEPIEIVTRHLCGANYPTLNLVHPYMESLKKKFAPRSDKNETVDTYLNFVYGEGYEENDDDEITDDDIPDAGTRQQWQYAHRQFHQRMSARGRGRGRTQQRSSRKRTRTESVAEDTNKVEDLPPVNTTNLLEKVRVAIYLSLDELWAIPTDTALIATFLDPRFKHFKWSTNSERDRANQLVKKLYDELKINLRVPDDIEHRSLEENNNDNDNLFSDLEGNFTQTNTEEEDEVSRYVKLQDIRVKDDPLMWWLNHRDSFPTLAQLARKYLSIPATSVPSE
ncbi:zinc finger BED domain-containing protein 1-like [Rhizophagus irregularis DAOM 181602=DAOM 197198]|nr:zinc finger BED domain-containing protein 1-like [Rhizophagus irregularis DAOM 181602=DAOM 197198]